MNSYGDILKSIAFLHQPGDVFEICLINPKVQRHDMWKGSAWGNKAIVAGWFDDPLKAEDTIKKLDERAKPDGVYITLNPCNPALMGRVNNKLKAGVNRTKDSEITHVHQLLIDVDPERPSGVSSSDVEKEAAKEVMLSVYDFLDMLGWPEPLKGDSGNGYHLIYKLDLANSCENIDIIKAVLRELDAMFSNEKAKVDKSVYNPARICKLYGTIARKGEAIKDRPHRRAEILSQPESPQPVSVDMLKGLVGVSLQAQSEGKKVSSEKMKTISSGSELDVKSYLDAHGIILKEIKPLGTITLYVLQTCLFDSTHSDGESSIIQTAEGKLLYQCFHDSCQDYTWHDARKIISGDDTLTPFSRGEVPSETTMSDTDELMDDTLPSSAIELVPESIKRIIEIGLETTQAHTDNLILGILSLIVPLADGSRVHSSPEDDQGEAIRLYNLLLGASGIGKTVVVSRFAPVLIYDLENIIKNNNDLRRDEIRMLKIDLKKLGKSEKDHQKRKDIEGRLSKIKISYQTNLIESATVEGLLKALEHNSNPIVILDEFGTTLQRSERSELIKGFIDMLTQIADRGSTKARITKGDDPPTLLADISMGILATTTPEDLPKKNALSLLRGGHLARYTISFITEARPLPDRDYLKENEIQYLKKWRDSIQKAVVRQNRHFELSPEAAECLNGYKHTVNSEFVVAINSGESDGGTIVRLIRKAKTFSLLLHLGDDSTRDDKKISLQTMQMACKLVDYYYKQHHKKLMRYLKKEEEKEEDEDFSKKNIGQRILKYLKENGGKSSIRSIYKFLHLRKQVTVTVLNDLKKIKKVIVNGQMVSIL